VYVYVYGTNEPVATGARPDGAVHVSYYSSCPYVLGHNRYVVASLLLGLLTCFLNACASGALLHLYHQLVAVVEKDGNGLATVALPPGTVREAAQGRRCRCGGGLHCWHARGVVLCAGVCGRGRGHGSHRGGTRSC
jgi:hypothetical protein